MAKQLLRTLLVAVLVPAALLCGDQEEACGSSQEEPSLARLVEDIHGENVLARLLPGKEEEVPRLKREATDNVVSTNTDKTSATATENKASASQKQAATNPSKTSQAAGDIKDDNKKPKVQDKTPPSVPKQTSGSNGKPAVVAGATTVKMAGNVQAKVEQKTQPSLPKQVHGQVTQRTDQGKIPASQTSGIKPDAAAVKKTDNLKKSSKMEAKTPSSTPKEEQVVKTNPGKTSSLPPPRAGGAVKMAVTAKGGDSKTPPPQQAVSRGKSSEPSAMATKEPQRRSATDVGRSEQGAKATPQVLEKAKSGSNSMGKASPSTPAELVPKPSQVKEAAGKEKTTQAAVNQISQRSEEEEKKKKEAHVKHDAGKDKTAPSLALKGQSSDAEVVKGKVLPQLPGAEKSPSLSTEKAAKTSSSASERSKKKSDGKDVTAGKGGALLPAVRKVAHVKASAEEERKTEKMQQKVAETQGKVAAARPKRDAEEEQEGKKEKKQQQVTEAEGKAAVKPKTDAEKEDEEKKEKKQQRVTEAEAKPAPRPKRNPEEDGKKEKEQIAEAEGQAAVRPKRDAEEEEGQKEIKQQQVTEAEAKPAPRPKRNPEEEGQKEKTQQRVTEDEAKPAPRPERNPEEEEGKKEKQPVAEAEGKAVAPRPKKDGEEEKREKQPPPLPQQETHETPRQDGNATKQQNENGVQAPPDSPAQDQKVGTAAEGSTTTEAPVDKEQEWSESAAVVEHVHFVAEADHVAEPEALPLIGPKEEEQVPAAMSLKTRRHPEDVDLEEAARGRVQGEVGGEDGAARQPDPRRFPPGGGYGRPKDTSEAPVLQFPALPDGETFRTPELGLSEGLFLFSYLGDFLSWLQPYDFPVELIRDALWNRVTVTDLITESLQVEIGFIVCLCIGALLALMLPIIAVCHACCNMVRGSKKSGRDSNSWDSSSSGGSCRRRGLLCSLHLVLVLLAVGVAAMFATNEQVSNAVHSTPSIVHTALGDVGAFVRTTHHQLSFVTTKSLEQALSAATEDLDNADVLLGRPIQQEIAHEAGADVALEALSDVLTAVTDVSQKAVTLHEQCSETRGLALVAKERLADLRHQVDMAKRQCVGRDRALCDTLDVSGLDVVIRLESLMSDDQLAALRSLRSGNFSAAAQQARADFQLIPREVEESTREARLGIRRELVRQRSYVQDSLTSLDSLSRDVGIRVDAARNLVLSSMQTVEEMEQWRWLVGLGACLTMLLLWVLLTAGATCGCCGSQEKARTTLIIGVCLTSFFSLVLWVMTLVTLVMGGHGEVFICRPLYASPDYNALSRLLDRPGVLFPRGGGGFFRNVVGGDYGPNRTLDVPLRQVLQECEAGIPAYNALQLRQVFDTEFATGHGRWDSLRMQLSRLNVDVASLRVLTPGLQVQLGNILTATGANVTQHRLALGGAVTARDLNTLADQLLGIASQASDLAMASRLETLAARTRRLLASHVLPLEQRKEDLVYRLTALEVSLAPLQRQTNQSLSHLKAIQYYVTHQGESIAQTAVNHYTTRILSYLQQARAHILTSVVKDVAPCRPLFEVFNAARQLLCRHIVDPLNGLWFASALSLLLLLIATPLCLKLVDAYKQNREGGLLTSNMSEYNIKSEKGLF